jgi:hypothetical protein
MDEAGDGELLEGAHGDADAFSVLVRRHDSLSGSPKHLIGLLNDVFGSSD